MDSSHTFLRLMSQKGIAHYTKAASRFGAVRACSVLFACSWRDFCFLKTILSLRHIVAPTKYSHENLGKPCLRFSVNLRALPSSHDMLMPSNFRNRAISPTEVHGHKCSALAQKRGFACAVIYLEYPHIYRHLLLSEIDYKHSLFGRFQIKKSIGRYLPMDSYFYVECPKNGMLITAFVHAERRNKSIRSESLSRPSAVQSR